MAGNDLERYVVSTREPLLRQLNHWAAEATALGLRTEYIGVLKHFNTLLETRPHSWGDMLRELHTIDVVFRRGMIAKWLLVWYGVHDEAKTVVVHDLAPAPGSPLSPRAV